MGAITVEEQPFKLHFFQNFKILVEGSVALHKSNASIKLSLAV